MAISSGVLLSQDFFVLRGFMDKILIGMIIKPQGIKGELKILPLCDSPEILKDIKSFYIDDEEYTPVSVRIADGVFIVFKGIADGNKAELFRDKNLYADKQDVPVEENKWFISDIISCKIFDNTGNFIGTAKDVITRGSTDFIIAATLGGKTVQFPFLKKVVESVSISEKKIIVEKERFAEVAFYED